MRNYYIFTASLIIFVVVLIITCFSIIGTPFEQKDIALDKKRINAFTTIQQGIESYTSNKSLPQSLSEVSYLNSTFYENNLKDPETQKPYEYKVISSSSYQLCTTFSLDSSRQDEYTKQTLTKANNTFKKGYNCFTYKATVKVSCAAGTACTSPSYCDQIGTPMGGYGCGSGDSLCCKLRTVTPTIPQPTPVTNPVGFYAHNADGKCCAYRGGCDQAGCGNKCSEIVNESFCAQLSPTP